MDVNVILFPKLEPLTFRFVFATLIHNTESCSTESITRKLFVKEQQGQKQNNFTNHILVYPLKYHISQTFIPFSPSLPLFKLMRAAKLDDIFGHLTVGVESK
jgi:hypothetical protein